MQRLTKKIRLLTFLVALLFSLATPILLAHGHSPKDSDASHNCSICHVGHNLGQALHSSNSPQALHRVFISTYSIPKSQFISAMALSTSSIRGPPCA